MGRDKSLPALLDISGRRVLAFKPGPNNVSRLAPGVYFLQAAESGEWSVARKVIVTR